MTQQNFVCWPASAVVSSPTVPECMLFQLMHDAGHCQTLQGVATACRPGAAFIFPSGAAGELGQRCTQASMTAGARTALTRR